MFGWRIPSPNEALLISGRKGLAADEVAQPAGVLTEQTTATPANK